MNENLRKIIHIDMDAFYASVEQADNPSLKGKPIAVGGSEKRGVVSAASYEARKYGVRSAISGHKAKLLCPELIFVTPRFERYREISQQIRQIFLEYTPLVEPLSLDEAYLDVTQNHFNLPSATLKAQEIRQKIFQKTTLTASAGISINKFVAKIASDYNKPNGQKTVSEQEVIPFLANLDIKKFYGIGSVTAQKMYKLGIFTGYDLLQKPLEFLQQHFGNSALHFYQIARGIYNSPVKPLHLPKSIGVECTYEENLPSEVAIMEKLTHISHELSHRLQGKKLKGKTITLKLKYSDFKVQTRSFTSNKYTDNEQYIYQTVQRLLFQEPLKNSVRLLGISVANLDINAQGKIKKYTQLEFNFPPH